MINAPLLKSKMEIEKIHHIAIICSNYEESKYFYTEIYLLRYKQNIIEQRDNPTSWICVSMESIYWNCSPSLPHLSV